MSDGVAGCVWGGGGVHAVRTRAPPKKRGRVSKNIIGYIKELHEFHYHIKGAKKGGGPDSYM